MDLQLKGKSVLITGGSKGIGLACALAFLKEGARVAIVSRSEDNLKVARDEIAALGFEVATVAADLAHADEAERAVAAAEAALGPLDVLVNSAGAARQRVAEELDASAWRAGMDAKYFPYINTMDGGAVASI
jgi:NAD(P)-dependent dehydrogenase (short-subunit alcohol dehydrogenase family)